MAKPGRVPKPAALHEANGTFRADRHGGVKLKVEIPEMPPGLSPTAQGQWNIVTQQLLAAGLVSDIDQLALRMLVESIALYVEAADDISNKGIIIVTQKGNVIQNPAVGIRNKAWSQIVKLAQQFGMTPSARTGLHLHSDREEDDVSDILGFKITA